MKPATLHTRRALLLAPLPVALWLTGCAQPPRAPAALSQPNYWSGRMALQVHDDLAAAQAAEQSFSASFELQGSQQQGQLTLLSPFGAVLAELQWSPQGAQLRQGGQLRESPSLDALVQETIGTALPLGALFSWLTGQEAAAPGWQADLAQMPQGRLRAERTHPLPRASLRLVLDR